MPNRYIRESAIVSEPVNSLSWLGEVFYRRLLNKADDFGRYTANHALLRAALFPLQMEDVSESHIGICLQECEAAGLIFKYKSKDGKPLLVINKWEQGRAKHSDFDEPPKAVLERMKTYVYICKHMKTYVADSDTDADAITDADANAVGATVEDSVWLDSLKANPAYAGIDVTREIAKAKSWAETKRRKFSREMIVNWLNRAEKPIAMPLKMKRTSIECPGWKTILNHEFPESIYSAGQSNEAHEWSDLPPEAQQLCWQTYKKQGAA